MTPDLYHRGQNDKAEGNTSVGLALDEGAIDWLSVTGKSDQWRDDACAVLRRVSEGDPSVGPGRHNYKDRLTWPNGVTLYRGHKESAAMVEIPGGACKRLGGAVVHELGRTLLIGGRCTRIDICRDQHVGKPGVEHLTLIGDIVAACRRGELCHARTYKVFDDRDATDQCVRGEGIYLGSPKSARFVRVYDKGLEQRDRPRGAWVRFEAQLREDCADAAAMAVFKAREWWPVAAGHMLGVVDFRESPSEVHLARRPTSPFWKAYCADVERMRPRIVGQPSTLAGFCDFARRCVFGPIMAAAEEAGVPMREVIALVAEELEVRDSAWKNPVVFELAAAVRERRRDST